NDVQSEAERLSLCRIHVKRRLGIVGITHGELKPAGSAAWFDCPVTLPPGFARLATRPLPTGSVAMAKTIGITVVACLTIGTALPTVRMTSTFRRTNSAAISA